MTQRIDLDSFRPLNGWFVVKMDPLSEKVDSGLVYKPDKTCYEHLQRKGTVLKTSRMYKTNAKGKEYEVPIDLKPGYRIVFSAIQGDRIYFHHFRKKMGDENIIMLLPSDVLLYENPEDEGVSLDDLTLG